MRIGIVGSRRRDTPDDFKAVRSAFEEHLFVADTVTIISGGCPKGGDRFAEKLADECGVSIVIFYADWEKHGRVAGFIRNTDIAEQSDFLIACVASDRTGGTEDTIKKFKKFHPEDWSRRLTLV